MMIALALVICLMSGPVSVSAARRWHYRRDIRRRHKLLDIYRRSMTDDG